MAITRFVVSSEVASPRMISTSFITGTGFMKCMPMTLSGREVRRAISVIEIELVLVARIASGLAMRSRSVKMRYLRPLSSLAASITSADSAAASSSMLRSTRARILTWSSAAIVPFFTCLSTFLAIVDLPLSSASCETSIIVTGKPYCAKT